MNICLKILEEIIKGGKVKIIIIIKIKLSKNSRMEIPASNTNSCPKINVKIFVLLPFWIPNNKKKNCF